VVFGPSTYFDQEPDTAALLRWFKSSRSAGASDNCVEVQITGTSTGVWDSKNPAGEQLILTHHAFSAFLESIGTAHR
jgi:hypothetical protein